MNLKSLNLYIHIPFCAKKCHYCAFYSSANSTQLVDSYCEALCNELITNHYSPSTINTIYLGGGTPSLIPAKQIARILETVYESNKIENHIEITLEANPDSLTKSKLLTYRECGINRISIGLQAWQDSHLKNMGRLYTKDLFIATYNNVREAGFTNVNIDLMFGLPNQTLEEWKTTVTEVIKLKPEHISCYSLELDNTSMWGTMYKLNKLTIPPSEVDREMFDIAIHLLTQAGYVHYEMSNFCLPGVECQHNLNFWHHQNYLGLGAGAHSYISPIHSHHVENIHTYISNGESIIDNTNSPEEEKREWLMKRFRLLDGFLKTEYTKTFGTKVDSDLANQLGELVKQNLITVSSDSIKPSRKGLDLYNQLVCALL